MKFYIDTCIWIDFIEDRMGFDSKPIGEYAHMLFAHIKSQEHVIIVNEFLVQELKSHYPESEIITLLSMFKTKNYIISKNHKIEAKELENSLFIPYGDALHAILARDSESILITRDKHFNMISWCHPKTPEDIIT